jgi:hypothetical protein
MTKILASASAGRPAEVSAPTRLAVAFALVAGVPTYLLELLLTWPDWDFLRPAGFAVLVAGYAAALGYVAALYLRLFSWVRDGFRPSPTLQRTRKTRSPLRPRAAGVRRASP